MDTQAVSIILSSFIDVWQRMQENQHPLPVDQYGMSILQNTMQLAAFVWAEAIARHLWVVGKFGVSRRVLSSVSRGKSLSASRPMFGLVLPCEPMLPGKSEKGAIVFSNVAIRLHMD